LDAKPLFALNLSKLKADFSSLPAASVRDFLAVLAITYFELIKMEHLHRHHQTNYQMNPL